MTSHYPHRLNRGLGMGCLLFIENALLLTNKIRSHRIRRNSFSENTVKKSNPNQKNSNVHPLPIPFRKLFAPLVDVSCVNYADNE